MRTEAEESRFTGSKVLPGLQSHRKKGANSRTSAEIQAKTEAKGGILMNSVAVKFQMTSKEYNAAVYLSEAGKIKDLMVEMLQHLQQTKTITQPEGQLSIESTLELPFEKVSEIQQAAKDLNVTMAELIRQVIVDQTEERIEIKRQRDTERKQRLYYNKGHQARVMISGETLELYENIFGRVKTTIEGKKEFEENVLQVFVKGLEVIKN
jgi:hypothetical protein